MANKGFHYEKDLPHQKAAVRAVLSVFDGCERKANGRGENPSLIFVGSRFSDNIQAVQKQNGISDGIKTASTVLDIEMETGTGKTYAYTQTLFEMHRQLGIYKFIIAVPTLSIKAGTEQFLASEALNRHFRLDFEGLYGQTQIELYTVQSQKAKKGKRSQQMPSEIVRFVQADDDKKIHILLLNMGMINSKTMRGEDGSNDGSVLLKELHHTPFEAVKSVKPVLILDEPHRFKNDNTTWQNLMAFAPQFVLRYGATFPEKVTGRKDATGKKIKQTTTDYHHLLYRLTALDAFNQDLVKGVRAHIQQIDGDDNTQIRFIGSDGKQARFEITHGQSNKERGKNKQEFVLNQGESLHKIHAAIDGLTLTHIHNKKFEVVLNGEITLTAGDVFHPFTYAQNVVDVMIRQAVKAHFEAEKELLARPDKIKPLTLFFIDDIQDYRDGDDSKDSLKNRFETCVKDEAEQALKTAEKDSAFYHSLQTVLGDVSATHGGYFSQDNSTDDEKIAKEISEILHDKESLLSLENPRRFIFSKWTLREGWDNPNVFGICKLRSSGSETSKLQEVGRGLRLPVNEFMARVKDGGFKLNYFVDSREADFVEKLKAEVNQSLEETVPTALNDDVFAKIQAAYPDESKKAIRQKLADLTDDDDNFIVDDVSGKLRAIYPLAFAASKGVKANKIGKAGERTGKVAMRVGKFAELKALWEEINQKAVLRYQISESECQALFADFLRQNKARFTQTAIRTQVYETKVDNTLLTSTEKQSIDDTVLPIVTLTYREFLHKLAQKSLIQMATLHRVFYELRAEIPIEKFMNSQTINTLCDGFNRYLLSASFSGFEVGYERIGGQVHPTKFTDRLGNPLGEINAADLGVNHSTQSPLENFLFESVFFDSPIEEENITEAQISEVTVFTKIPKNAIKIPVTGGSTYSPDFAYIVKTQKGETLNLVVESKDVRDSSDLREIEQKKIEHAEKWFADLGGRIKVQFKTQFEGQRIVDFVQDVLHTLERSAL